MQSTSPCDFKKRKVANCPQRTGHEHAGKAAIVGQFLKKEELRLKLLQAGAELGGNKSTNGRRRGIGERSRSRSRGQGGVLETPSMEAKDAKKISLIFKPIYGFTCLK
jgi:hypothetical protein